MPSEKLVIGEPHVVALAALTLTQALIGNLIKNGRIEEGEVRDLIDNAVALHLQTPAGQSETNREVAAALRMIGDDLLKQG